MKKEIDYWLSKFPEMTQEEVDYIEKILLMNHEKKAAFFLAKKIFEDKDELDQR